MPIRMVEDDEPSYDNNDEGSSGGGGGGGLGCLFALLPLAFRYPKIAAVVVIVALAFGYFGSNDSNSRQVANNEDNTTNTTDVRGRIDGPHSHGLGADLKQSEFDKADVFASLAPNKNTLPDRVTLEEYAPNRKDQGTQGSCVAWSSAYAARTILQAYASGQDPNQLVFSPSFLYNQIGLEDCQGAYINEAMDLMTRMGSVPFAKFKYDENDCSREPSAALKQEAAQFKMRGYNRLTASEKSNNYNLDMMAIKANLAQGAPVVIGMMVGGSFMENMFGKKIWRPTSTDRRKSGFGGHAMCVIGYDDNLEGGAFQIMNSWGPKWGENGIAWVRYSDFKEFVREAYGLDPMPRSNMDKSKFSAAIGLVRNNDKEYIPLNVVNGNVFSSAKIKKGDKFKMEITNSVECFIYVFGMETDGSSYVLFPYTPKHSPFCGIVGTRLFPSDHSMQADEIGTQDYIAVVVTKNEIDYNALNNKITASKKGTYRERVMDALGNEDIEGVQFKGGQRVQFETDAKGKNAVAMIVEINKQ